MRVKNRLLNVLRASRIAVAIIGSIAGFAVIGGVLQSLALDDWHLSAIICVLLGVLLACYLWWRESYYVERSALLHGFALFSCWMAGLALYCNLAWDLWAAGVPMDIGTVHYGRMAEHYWLGPISLAYAGICFATLRWQRK